MENENYGKANELKSNEAENSERNPILKEDVEVKKESKIFTQEFLKVIKRKVLPILAFVLAVALFVSGIIIDRKLNSNKKELPGINLNHETTINVDLVKAIFKNVGELRTAKVTFGCLSHYSEGKYTALTKKSFYMYYDATAYAGIDISSIEVSQNDDGKYIITLPKVTIYDPQIDPKTIEFFGEDKALFNWQNHLDTKKALELAEKDVNRKAAISQLRNMAKDNATVLVKNLLNQFLDENSYEIISPEIDAESYSFVSSPISSNEIDSYSAYDLIKKLEQYGFSNISKKEIPVKSWHLGKKDGEIESILIDGNSSFMYNDQFAPDVEVAISYYVKNK
ncbi:MAG: DUF4230 domain-containing protein [Clostridia bacterium]|nr:DUF4230 domain-containing protein [Clostridia bacterium]